MIDFIISKKSIAIIIEIDKDKFKIAFGTSRKKVFNKEFTNLAEATEYARKLGFGLYYYYRDNGFMNRSLGNKFSLKWLLEKEVKWKTVPRKLSDEKDWRHIYNKHGAG